MKLNEQGKNELRKEIEYQLKNVPEGQRVHLKKDLLEDLLFEKIIYEKETGKFFKLPIWSGDFLSKIDLSEVSFEDVAWNIRLPEKKIYHDNDIYKIMEFIYGEDIKIGDIEKEVYTKFKFHNMYALKDGEKINYSNTNANIDFKKSYKNKHNNFFEILYCNFSGTDLSNNILDKGEFSIFHADLSYTKLDVNYIVKDFINDKGACEIYYTNLCGLDLSNINITADLVMRMQCNVIGTGLKIKENYELIDKNIMLKESIKFFKMMNQGYFDGCYIDGKLISTGEQNKKIANEKLKEYQKFKQGIINSISDSIEEQVRNMKK